MPDQVSVTHEDERAAHAFLDLTYGGLGSLALAFARHRQAAIQKARADALEEAAKVAESFELAGIGIESVEDHFQAQLDDVATAIRSLTEREVSQ